MKRPWEPFQRIRGECCGLKYSWVPSRTLKLNLWWFIVYWQIENHLWETPLSISVRVFSEDLIEEGSPLSVCVLPWKQVQQTGESIHFSLNHVCGHKQLAIPSFIHYAVPTMMTITSNYELKNVLSVLSCFCCLFWKAARQLTTKAIYTKKAKTDIKNHNIRRGIVKGRKHKQGRVTLNFSFSFLLTFVFSYKSQFCLSFTNMYVCVHVYVNLCVWRLEDSLKC